MLLTVFLDPARKGHLNYERGDKVDRDFVLTAASDVAMMIQPQLSQEEETKFVELFMNKAHEMLGEKKELFVGFGLQEKTSSDYFSEDMKAIMQYVEGETKRKYSFIDGRLLIFFGIDFGMGIWEK